MSCMFTDPNTLPIVAKAAKTNSRRDAIDAEAGFPAPSECPVDVYLRTAMTAIHCGLSTSNFDAVAEGYAMLQDIHTIIATGARKKAAQ